MAENFHIYKIAMIFINLKVDFLMFTLFVYCVIYSNSLILHILSFLKKADMADVK